MNDSRALPLTPSSLSAIATHRHVAVPMYDRARVEAGWVHIGCGAFHRAHQAIAAEQLLTKHFGTHLKWGLVGVNLLPTDRALCDVLRAQSGLYSVLQRDLSGERLQVVGSISDVLHAPSELSAVTELLCSPNVRLITLTITEGGYYFDRATDRFLVEHPDIVHDLGLQKGVPKSALGLLAKVLAERFARGVTPPTILSCDNVKENGAVLRRSLISFCERKDPILAEKIAAISFPNSMVDRITPRITDRDRAHIESEYGIVDKAPVVCESFWQWVIEDRFPEGRPAFEEVPGVIFTGDVRPYEDMKLRLLNAGHSQCGYLGHLAGFTLIDQVAQDTDFRALLKSFWNEEVIPNLPPVPGIDFYDYCESLVARFSNPNLGDQTLRICLDGSAKIPTFVLPSVRDGLKKGTPIVRAALCVAAWIRFCSGIGERGESIPIEDPCASELLRLGKAVADSPSHDARIFISALPLVFGELSSDPRFTDQVSQMVSMLYKDGARKTLTFVLK